MQCGKQLMKHLPKLLHRHNLQNRSDRIRLYIIIIRMHARFTDLMESRKVSQESALHVIDTFGHFLSIGSIFSSQTIRFTHVCYAFSTRPAPVWTWTLTLQNWRLLFDKTTLSRAWCSKSRLCQAPPLEIPESQSLMKLPSAVTVAGCVTDFHICPGLQRNLLIYCKGNLQDMSGEFSSLAERCR